MLSKINNTEHIITIEDPIEFVHPHKNCLVNQRELHQGHQQVFRRTAGSPARKIPTRR